MDTKKILAIFLSIVLVFSSAFIGTAFAEQQITEKETVLLDEEELSRSRVREPGDYAPVGDWYTQVEPMYSYECDRIKAYFPDIWAKYENGFIYTDNGQLADREQNLTIFNNMTREAEDDEKNMIVGDFNSDNKLSVADARIVLRVAVKIQEIPEYINPNLMDLDFNGMVNVANARLVLRSAIDLDSLSYTGYCVAYDEIIARYSYRIKTF